VNDHDDDPPLLRREQLVEWFIAAEKKRDQLIGTEQEKFALRLVETEPPRPVAYETEVKPVLEALVERFGWRPGKDRGLAGELIALERGGASITLEPGGQIELSGAPLSSVHETCAEFTQHYHELEAIADPLGLAFLCVGFHPFATREEIQWMPKGRYAVMRAYLPTRGARALDMMLRTCTVQANLDYADEAQCGLRLRTAMAVSAVITAMFANSPYREGAATGLRSTRSATWEEVDPHRCGLLPWVFSDPFSYERYVDWALRVPMFFVKREGIYHAHHVPFAEYLRDGFSDARGRHHRATKADWELHLNTLFPEVRLNPFLEIRGADSVGSRWVCALPALSRGILYDEQARQGAWELVAGLDFAERRALWNDARTCGLSLPRLQGLARRLLDLARGGLERLDVRDSKGRTEARFLDSLEPLVDAGRCPADDAFDALGPAPGRGAAARLAFLREFGWGRS
jgi:glutamate--cysteine ligase